MPKEGIQIIVHHLIKEKDALKQCIYCNKDLQENRWISEHIHSIHYKTTDCSCGKKNSIKIKDPYFSSGHDNWDGKGWISLKEFTKIKKKRLESKI